MHLVLGTPDPVARGLIARLVDEGELVAALGGPGSLDALPHKVTKIQGDPASIDFGLSGSAYADLARQVTRLTLCDATPWSSADVERSRALRQAAEVVEFVKAGSVEQGVTFLSSLLVFGGASGVVSEDELNVGQSFRDTYEESLAVAEKLIQGLSDRCPVAIVRAAPVAGELAQGELLPDSPLAHLARELKSGGEGKGFAFSDLPIRFETVERLVEALAQTTPRKPALVVHLADEEPLTDRQLIEWLAQRLGKSVHESPPGVRPWSFLVKGAYPGDRAVSGWGLRFERQNAQQEIPSLLDRDDWGVLERLFPRERRE